MTVWLTCDHWDVVDDPAARTRVRPPGGGILYRTSSAGIREAVEAAFEGPARCNLVQQPGRVHVEVVTSGCRSASTASELIREALWHSVPMGVQWSATVHHVDRGVTQTVEPARAVTVEVRADDPDRFVNQMLEAFERRGSPPRS